MLSKFNWLALALLLGPISAVAADKFCLDASRAAYLSPSLNMPSYVQSQLNASQNDLQRAPRTGEFFSRDLNLGPGQEATALYYDFKKQFGTNTISAHIGWRVPEQISDKTVLSVQDDYIVYDQDFLPSLEYIQVNSLDSNCQSRAVSSTVIFFRRSTNGKMVSSKVRNSADHDGVVTHPIFEQKTLSESIRVANVHTLADLQALAVAKFHIVDLGDSTDVIMEAAPTGFAQRRIFNPFSRRIETANGLAFELSADEQQAGRAQFLFASGGYVAQFSAPPGRPETLTDFVSRDLWLTMKIQAADSEGRSLSIKGLTDAELAMDAGDFLVSAGGVPPTLYSNMAMYFETQWVKDATPGTWALALRKRALSLPVSTPWNKRLRSDQIADLQATDLIQISAVREQVATLRPQLKGLTRLQAAVEVTKLVNTLIQYDYGQVDNNTTDLMSTSEILRHHKGVCQHFSNVATAILRGLGIPTRMVSGFALYGNGAFGHSWIEVKVSDSVWWPLDSEYAGADHLANQGYLPILRDGAYEIQNHDQQAFMAEIIRQNALMSGFDRATLEKLPPGI